MMTLMDWFLFGLVVLVTLRWLRWERNIRKTVGAPVIHQWIDPNSLLLRILPVRLFGVFEWFPYRPNWVWSFKYDQLYGRLKSDIVVFASPDRTTVTVADPAAIDQITSNRQLFPKPLHDYKVLNFFGSNIVTTEDEDWKRHRKIASPVFSESNNRLVHEQTLHNLCKMVDHWNYAAKQQAVIASQSSGIEISALDELVKLTLYIISGAGFGVDLPWESAENRNIPAGHSMTFTQSVEIVSTRTIMRLVFPEWTARMLPWQKLKETHQGYNEFGTYIAEIIADAKRMSTESPDQFADRHDLLSALVRANTSMSADNLIGGRMLSDKEINGDVFIFMIAGHETTAHTMVFALTLLAMNPAIQDKLHGEIIEVLHGSRQPEYEDFPKLEYTMAVINETLRLFPPVILVPKTAGERCELNGCVIEPGVDVYLNVAAMHRNPRYWGADANEFRPERFMEDKSAEVKGAYLPFSLGQRSCLGRRFAQIESVCILAFLLQRFRIELADSVCRETALECESILTLTPKKDLRLKFIGRDLAPAA